MIVSHLLNHIFSSYSFDEKIWTEEVDMNNQRAMHSMIRSGSKLYVFGGTGADESTGEVYSTKDGIWGVFSWSVPMNDGVSMEPGSPVVIRYENIRIIFALNIS